MWNYREYINTPYTPEQRLNWNSCGGIRESVEVKQSTIPNAGDGVFTLQPFRRGDVITGFPGQKRKRTSNPNDYAVALNKTFDLCPSIQDITSRRRGHHVGHLINHSGSKRKINVELCEVAREHCFQVVVVAKRGIRTGSELFLNYGAEAAEQIKMQKKVQKA